MDWLRPKCKDNIENLSSSHFGWGDSLKAELQATELAENAFGVQALACLLGSTAAKMRIAVAPGKAWGKGKWR